MSAPHHRIMLLLLLVPGVVPGGLRAQPWSPTPVARASSRPSVIASTHQQPAAVLGKPAPAQLGRPQAMSQPAAAPASSRPTVSQPGHAPPEPPRHHGPAPAAVTQVDSRSGEGLFPLGSHFPRPGDARDGVILVRGQSPDDIVPVQLSGPPPVPPPAGGPPSYDLPPLPEGGYNPGVVIDRPLNQTFWDKCRGWFGGWGHPSTSSPGSFQSHCYDSTLISPVTNPFYFEDPRALTELRPILMYQTAPSGNPVFRGGAGEFFGVQGRVAFSERWSLVLNKLGLVALQPNTTGLGLEDDAGFSEIYLGPKWTFLRNERTGTFGAVGLTFELPVGSSKVYQNTGDLGLDPYITMGQTFGRSSYGSFNFLGALGYNFSIDDERSEFFHTSLHLSYDIANARKLYPFLELNWFHYTNLGTNTPYTFEGTDLVNFGSALMPNKDIFTVGTGFRYKFSEQVQLGLGGEWTLTNNENSIRDFRVTLDMIFRY